MANYREDSVTGVTWQRCNKIDIRNPLEGQKFVVFVEEAVTDLGNGKILKEPVGQIVEEFVDPAVVVPLLHPETGALLGSSVTYQDIYVILHSLYLKLANERDAVIEL
jgi:hypothetical protein